MRRPKFFRVKSLLFGCLLLVLTWGIFPSSVQAGKTPKSLTFAGPDAVEIAAIYETAYATQKGTVKSVKLNSKAMKKAAGFQGAVTLKSQDGKQVIVLSQWQDLASYQAYMVETPTIVASSGAKTTATDMPPPATPSQTLVFQVEKAQPSLAGTIPALRGKEAVVQFSTFSAKRPEERSNVLAQVDSLIPPLLQSQPIPQSVLLLNAIETGETALMVNWNCSALFEDVGYPQPLAPDQTLLALADYQQGLYDVVNLIPAEAKKAKSED